MFIDRFENTNHVVSYEDIISSQNKANELFQSGKPQESINVLEGIVSTLLSDRGNHVERRFYLLCDGLLSLFDINLLNFQLNKSIDLINKVNQLATKKLDELDKQKIHYLILSKNADIFYERHLRQKALEIYFEAVDFFNSSKINDNPTLELLNNLSFTHRQISKIFFEMNNIEKGVIHLSEALETLIRTDRFEGYEPATEAEIAYREELQALIFHYQNKPKRSKKYFISSLHKMQQINASNRSFDSLYNLARAHQNMGVLCLLLGKSNDALKEYKNSEKLYGEIGEVFKFKKITYEAAIIDYKIFQILSEINKLDDAALYKKNVLKKIKKISDCKNVLPLQDIEKRVAA